MTKRFLEVLALFLHVIFLCSVFDIYFKSPIVKSDQWHRPYYGEFEPPARRVFLIVADGLRAQTYFDNQESLAPYLTKTAKLRGSWGVSHTRVPTESRPGHVALIAGMYEDPSAITRGWRENPVDFDTVFNQSRNTFAWGSPDILPMFAKAITIAESYSPEFEDFSAESDSSKLDTWVFQKVEAFFEKARNSDVDLQLKLREDKNIFFLHLLGCDTIGHKHKPYSKQYLDNIKLVDEGVKKVEEMANNYWRRDGRTAFIFTADHGMTDWGSHGAGMDHETQTPIVVWGAGIKNNSKKVEIRQADVAPLVSALLGINVPQNSVGKLPTDLLDIHPSLIIDAMLANALQIYEQFSSYRRIYGNSFFHTEFPGLKNKNVLEDAAIAHRKIGKYKEALGLATKLYENSMAGLEYYRTYHRTSLYFAICSSYVGFIIYVVIVLLREFTIFVTSISSDWKKYRSVCGILVLVILILNLMQSSQPLHYIIYFVSPVIIWTLVIKEFNDLRLTPTSFNKIQLLIFVIVSFLILEGIILAFFDRRVLSLTSIVVMLTQFYFYESRSTPKIKASWLVSSLGLCAFSFQPSVGREKNANLVLFSSVISTLMAFWVVKQKSRQPQLNVFSSLAALSGLCVWITSTLGTLYLPVQITSWIIGFGSLPLVLLSTVPKFFQRLFSLLVSLQAIYILLCLTYEGLFQLCLIWNLLTWLLMEYGDLRFGYYEIEEIEFSSCERERNSVTMRDIFRALLYIFFSVVSFFGTGNIASINSFDPKSIQCFVSVFSPFVMGGLLLLKIIIPFLVVSLIMTVVTRVTKLSKRCLFLTVLIFFDVLSLHFFFLVTDQGSWLEIGTSLSHFVIAQAIVIFLQLLFLLAQLLLRSSLFVVPNKKFPLNQ